MKKIKVNVATMTSLNRINMAVEFMNAGDHKKARELLMKEPMMYGRNPITKTNPPTQEELHELNHAINKIFEFGIKMRLQNGGNK